MKKRERKISFVPGYVKDDSIHGMHILFELSCDFGAVVFDIYTQWYPASAKNEWEAGIYTKRANSFGRSIEIHSKNRSILTDVGPVPNCKHTKPYECYSANNSMDAKQLFPRFVTEGEDVIWTELELLAEQQDMAIEDELSDARNFS